MKTKIHESATTVMSPQDREITSLTATATSYHGRAHILLPKSWRDQYVTAVLSDVKKGIKIAHITTKFGNGAHLVLPAEFAGKRVYCKREHLK